MNVSDDGKTIKLKKDVIKNIAIVFLAIMLILTFFSNSIMNRSLPEVATESIGSGTITEKIRGTGTIEADDPYSVTVSETRKISSVAVKEGDEVTKGQVLFYFEDEESEELLKAEDELEDLIYKYTVGALTGEMSDQAYHNATTGQVSSMGAYEARIEAARARVNAAQDNVDSITRQIALLDGTSDSYAGSINDAKLELEKAQLELDKKKTTYTELRAIVDGGDGGAGSAQSEYELAAAQYESAKAQYGSSKQTYDLKQGTIRGYIANDSFTTSTVIASLKTRNANKYNSVTTGEDVAKLVFGTGTIVVDGDALNDWSIASGYSTSNSTDYSDFLKAVEDITKADATLTAAKTNLDAKQAAYSSASSKAAAFYDAKSRLGSAESDYNNAKNRVDELQTYITSLNNEQSANSAGNKELASQLAVKKADAELELSKAKSDQTQLLLDISKTLDLTNQNSIIKEQQEKVEKLREKATGATVTAPVDGIILSVSKKAGETTSASDPIATIQVSGKPMRLSITVTAEQAKKVSVGDRAELQNAWYYTDSMNIVLTKIANDPNNPRKNKILMFNVEGDVTNGESLNISIGQKSRDYEKVVPNNAIKEDNRGKFIYIIEEKGTPFGNRYKARRVDVEVLASDDTRTAISADIDNWAYVITTSNKPIEAGQQVRFTDK